MELPTRNFDLITLLGLALAAITHAAVGRAAAHQCRAPACRAGLLHREQAAVLPPAVVYQGGEEARSCSCSRLGAALVAEGVLDVGGGDGRVARGVRARGRARDRDRPGRVAELIDDDGDDDDADGGEPAVAFVRARFGPGPLGARDPRAPRCAPRTATRSIARGCTSPRRRLRRAGPARVVRRRRRLPRVRGDVRHRRVRGRAEAAGRDRAVLRPPGRERRGRRVAARPQPRRDVRAPPRARAARRAARGLAPVGRGRAVRDLRRRRRGARATLPRAARDRARAAGSG